MAGARFELPGAAPLEFRVNPAYPGRVVLRSGSVRAETEGGGVTVRNIGSGLVVLNAGSFTMQATAAWGAIPAPKSSMAMTDAAIGVLAAPASIATMPIRISVTTWPRPMLLASPYNGIGAVATSE